MYSIRNVVTQEPAAIQLVIMSLLSALVVTGVINLSEDALAVWGVVILGALNLFYIRPLSVSKSGLAEVEAARPARAKKAARKA